ncbi:unnamed protein product [Phaedon cochleariae]|uniref:DnaJ-like protein n=1 Tax=Phaedon cochleariae TaxID=80249 RepID=A0A9N9S820_PHACE|nr:unnamed protein product [Phaedon cochleariae]CAH1117018.1 unnamed protein product [Phaedon cochleariae]
MYIYVVSFIILVYCNNSSLAWDSEQLEVFDTVDEVKQNFYDFLNISQNATNLEIRSAYRGLTVKLHPDKNKDVDTSEQFRNLVSVYEVLRSSTKRKYYDEVLVKGLPNWRSGLFYYRFVRKMGVAEVLAILFVIISIGQYLVNWGAYLEKKLTLQDQISKKKKSNKKARVDELDIVIPKPSILDTLPVQIPCLIWYLITSMPTALGLIKKAVEEKIEEANREPTPEPEPIVKVKTVRKRNKFVVPEGPNFEMQKTSANQTASESTAAPISGGLWTDDDLGELIRLVKKHPQGSAARWEKIAEALMRSVPEVTYMAAKMKENGYRLPSEQEEEIVVKVKQKTKKDVDKGEGVLNWSQDQQRALEDALLKFPKGCSDRWDRIAEQVSGKTKEECMMRFRFLAEDLKKRKENPESDEQLNQ